MAAALLAERFTYVCNCSMQHVNYSLAITQQSYGDWWSKSSALGIGLRHHLGSRTSSSGAQQIIEDIILPVPVPVQGLVIAVCLPFASPRVHLYLRRVEELNMSQEPSL